MQMATDGYLGQHQHYMWISDYGYGLMACVSSVTSGESHIVFSCFLMIMKSKTCILDRQFLSLPDRVDLVQVQI